MKSQESHEHNTGVFRYADAPSFYEDFDDKWRGSDPLMRYAQRIDVEEWQFYDANGVPWLSGLKVLPFEIQKAFFKIEKKFFDQITKALTASDGRKTKKRKRNDGPDEIVDEAVVEATEKSHARSQGFLLDSELRMALEKYSMDAATRYFASLGYKVENHSKNHPYDLKCSGSKATLYVEVKGTQTNGKGIILTHGEVEFARLHSDHMALFIRNRTAGPLPLTG